MAVISIKDLDSAPVRVLSINRPEKRNAFNKEVVDTLRKALLEFEASDQRVLVLRGEGEHFCAGADLSNPPGDFWRSLPGVGLEITKPIVCAVQGWAIGLGFAVTMMSDMVICADDCRFAFPEAKIGVFGGIGAGLVARIPQKVALEFLMMGEPMSARRAYEVGMVNRVVPRAELEANAIQMATVLAGMAPLVVAAIKRWTAQTTPKAPMEMVSVEAAVLAAMRDSNDVKEGVSAFREKRAPRFTGT